MSNMTQEEFLDDYFEDRTFNREKILTSHVPLLCNCGAKGCPGWLMTRDQDVANHLRGWLEKENEDC